MRAKIPTTKKYKLSKKSLTQEYRDYFRFKNNLALKANFSHQKQLSDPEELQQPTKDINSQIDKILSRP